jgi:stigma-specific protein Stig1
VRTFLLLVLLLASCVKPCPLLCAADSDCVQQAVLPGQYCVSNTCLDDCYRCGGNCVPIQANCGACFNACPGDKPKCYQGTCTTACPSNTTDCSGSCYDTLHDRTNCGTCGHTCGHEEICANGQCSGSICG